MCGAGGAGGVGRGMQVVRAAMVMRALAVVVVMSTAAAASAAAAVVMGGEQGLSVRPLDDQSRASRFNIGGILSNNESHVHFKETISVSRIIVTQTHNYTYTHIHTQMVHSATLCIFILPFI